MGCSLGEEVRVYGGEIQMGGDPCIKVPGNYTNYLGVHVLNRELERVGVVDFDKDTSTYVQIFSFLESHEDT